MAILGKHSLDDLLASIDADDHNDITRHESKRRCLFSLEDEVANMTAATTSVRAMAKSPTGGIINDMDNADEDYSDDEADVGNEAENQSCNSRLERIRAMMGPRLPAGAPPMTRENTSSNTIIYGATLSRSSGDGFNRTWLTPTTRTVCKYTLEGTVCPYSRISNEWAVILGLMSTHESQVDTSDGVSERTNACVIHTHLTVPTYGRLALIHTMVLRRYTDELAAAHPGIPPILHTLPSGLEVASMVVIDGGDYHPVLGGTMHEAIHYTREALVFLYCEYVNAVEQPLLIMYPWNEGFTSMVLSGFTCLLRHYATSKFRTSAMLTTANYRGGVESTKRAVRCVELVCGGCGCNGIGRDEEHLASCKCTTLVAGNCCLLCLVFRFGVFYDKGYLCNEVVALGQTIRDCYRRGSLVVGRLMSTFLK